MEKESTAHHSLAQQWEWSFPEWLVPSVVVGLVASCFETWMGLDNWIWYTKPLVLALVYALCKKSRNVVLQNSQVAERQCASEETFSFPYLLKIMKFSLIEATRSLKIRVRPC